LAEENELVVVFASEGKLSRETCCDEVRRWNDGRFVGEVRAGVEDAARLVNPLQNKTNKQSHQDARK